FLADRMNARVQEVGEKIAVALAKHNPQAAEGERQVVTAICSRIERQASLLQNQLIPPTPLKFDEEGGAALTNWVVSKIEQEGQVQIDRQRGANDKTLLHIATQKGGAASWRTTTSDLEPGTYLFTARIKTKGVVFPSGDERAGAGLRIGLYKKGQKNSGDRD